jgi:hypothetical protein
MRYAKFVLLALTTACASASGPTVRVTNARPETWEPRPASYDIRIYTDKDPRCAYTTIAQLSTDQTRDIRTVDDLLKILRDKAREMGGDAIMKLGHETSTAGFAGHDQSYTLEKTEVWSGTLIRWKAQDCAE